MFGPNFGFVVVMALTALIATGCGFPFALIAYVRMASRPGEAKPSAVLSFAGTIPCNIAAIVSIWWYPRNPGSGMILGVDSTVFMISGLLFISFVLLMITLGLLYGYRGAGRRPLQVGSISLIVLYVLGYIGALSG